MSWKTQLNALGIIKIVHVPKRSSLLLRAITDSLVAVQNTVSEQDLLANSKTLTGKQHVCSPKVLLEDRDRQLLAGKSN